MLRENTQGQQQNTSISLKDARTATDKAYKWMILCLNSYKVVDQDPDRFTAVTSNLIAQQEYYLGLVKDRQRTNKRVQVKSEEIGNHTYAVSSRARSRSSCPSASFRSTRRPRSSARLPSPSTACSSSRPTWWT